MRTRLRHLHGGHGVVRHPRGPRHVVTVVMNPWRGHTRPHWRSACFHIIPRRVSKSWAAEFGAERFQAS